MRGKDGEMLQVWKLTWITPAYAGKSFRHLSSATIQQDHPRLCGEKLHMPEKFVWRLGSPPPMRGKVPILVAAEPRTRITPAYAGKRTLTCCTSPAWEDHPRLCGEKWYGFSIHPTGTGSPPPMRGKARTEQAVSMQRRITPAYAGKRV